MATMKGKFEVGVFASYIEEVSKRYNKAAAMIERNNHGHAVILWLQEHTRVKLLKGHDKKVGWLSSVRGKSILYAGMNDTLKNEETIIHSSDTFSQLASIEGGTLRAPEGLMDDDADSYCLASAGTKKQGRRSAIW